ncbi:hypothetical protein BAE44_0003827 [Dichanthelium oligosanthes]|uniref:Uncharacterized protein n=1 Tax=Dichanthelium oligosanthes TaxID=888268 RepID=A0A1E5WCJ1_9POAL|nr:hypothetical protein BAE44_0003827 [Dichanthelium oligosanthes]
MAQNKWVCLTVYVQTNTKGAELRQAMATSRQHPTPFIVDPRISKLPGVILASDWREELHFWHMNIEHKLYLENMYCGSFSTALFHESLLKSHHPLHNIVH